MDLKTLFLLVVLLPLLGFVVNVFTYKRFVRSTAGGWLSTVLVGLAFLLVCVSFPHFVHAEDRFVLSYFPFLYAHPLQIDFSFLVDRLNILYLLVITGVGFFIHLYSISYMKGDPGYGRYFAYLNLFVVSMLLLVLGANFLILFIGWEGVGLCSFLLIGFWYDKQENMYAARKAFVMNRVGDFCFLLAMFLLFKHYGTLDFVELPRQVHTHANNPNTLFWVTILLFLGATGKSAQIPLYTWLPDAMAGPTPVSALIHAATMVTAGIYLVARTQFLFLMSPLTMNIIAIVGLLTALVAALIATKQSDIKKVLAYSTVSQLGFMFIALGTGAFQAAIFHVITHAFFKALLFLGSGSVIHAMRGEQDITKMGGLGKKMPLTRACFLFGCLAIAGVPFFSGFVSKDAILLSAFVYGKVYFFFALMAAFLTAYYMFRLYFLTFHGQFRSSADAYAHVHESPALMTIPLVVLAGLSIFGGLFNVPHLFGGHEALFSFLHPVVKRQLLAHVPLNTELLLMFAPVLVIAGLIFASRIWYVHKLNIQNVRAERGLSLPFARKFYVDECYHWLVVQPVDKAGQFIRSTIEAQIIDGVVRGVGRLSLWGSAKLRYIQNGRISAYMFWMVLGMVVLLGVVLLPKR